MAKPGPKPSGCINEVKLMLTNEDYDDLRLFMAIHGISSLSESGRVALRRFFRGALGSLPNLAPFVTRIRPTAGHPSQPKVRMDIDLDPAIEADLEFIAAKTLIPAADIAGALITAGLHGWAHPLVCRFWANSGVSIEWPQMAAQSDDDS